MSDHQQQYANSFWAWLIIGGLVHYYSGFGWIAGILYFLGVLSAIASVHLGIRKVRLEQEEREDIENSIADLEAAHTGYKEVFEDDAKRMDDMAEEFSDNPEIAEALRNLADESRGKE